jgi:hypothetical protein
MSRRGQKPVISPEIKLVQDWDASPGQSSRIKAEYDRTVELLKTLGIHHRVDKQLVMQRAQAVVLALDAFATLEREGHLAARAEPGSKTKKCHPSFLVWDRATQMLATLDRALGLVCPRTRSVVEAEPDPLSRWRAMLATGSEHNG